MTETTQAEPDLTARAELLRRGRRFGVPLPDALMAVVFAFAASIDFLTPEQLTSVPQMFIESREELLFLLIVEGGFLMMQGTLIDIATRLKKRPPVWVIPIIVAAVAIFSSQSLDIIRLAWARGSAVFIPLLLSLLERGFVLWNLPNRTRIQKIAARALIGNRITTGLALFGLVTLTMVLGAIFSNQFDFTTASRWPALAAGAIYFAVAAYDDWRVRGSKFAARPRVLFRFDPMHIDYLEPL